MRVCIPARSGTHTRASGASYERFSSHTITSDVIKIAVNTCQAWGTTAAVSVGSRRWASTSSWSTWRLMWSLQNSNPLRQGKTPTQTRTAVSFVTSEKNGGSYLIPSCLPVCCVWQGRGPLWGPPTGAALTAAALLDLRPAFGSTFLRQQPATRQSTRVGCVSSPAPDCQLLGDMSRLIYRTYQTATRLEQEVQERTTPLIIFTLVRFSVVASFGVGVWIRDE